MGEAPSAAASARVSLTEAGLRRFVPVTAAERDMIARMHTLLAAGPASFRRDHLVPGHFTASAFVLSSDRARVLLIHHSKLGLWLQPGGHVEPDDADLLSAARREVAEEVGLSRITLLSEDIFDVDIHDIPAGREAAHQHFDVRYLFVAGEEALQAGSDALAARWVPLAEVEQQNSDASVMRAIARIRQQLS